MAAYRKLDRLNPNFKKKVLMFMRRCKAAGLDIFITETYRSLARQVMLKATGKSWTLKSKHRVGKAIDIAWNGKELYPNNAVQWNKVYDIAKGCGIDSGFKMWGVDKPHLQCDGSRYAEPVMETETRNKIIKLNSDLWNLTNDDLLRDKLNKMNNYLRSL